MTELSQAEAAVVARFDAAEAAPESLRERVARKLYEQWRATGDDPADLPEWEDLEPDLFDEDELDPKGWYRERADELLAVMRGDS